MNTAFPLTVFFDASCALCSSEMQNIKLNDSNDQLVLVDCSAPDFDDASYREDGVTRDAMMRCLHAQDAQGRWLRGVAAFEVIYRAVRMTTIAKLWAHPLLRPLAERAYPLVVRHRYMISALGLHKLFNLWSRRVARKANSRSQACREGRCTLP